LYSLRRSCILCMLLFGRDIDTLTLARKDRTSPKVIDRLYAAPLQGEMNVAMLQSKSSPRPWELHRGPVFFGGTEMLEVRSASG